MPELFRTTRRVEFRDTDCAGLIHFSAFIHYMEEVEHEFLRSRGVSVLMPDRGDGGPLGWPRVAVECNFRSPVRFEDLLDVTLWITRRGRSSVTYAVQFENQGRLVAEGTLTSVCCRLDAAGQPRSVPIPDWFAVAIDPRDEAPRDRASTVPPEAPGE